MPMGRPTDYRPEYCDMLVEHMSKGYSYESFAGLIGTCKQTIYTWEKVNPQFLDAKSRAFAACHMFWEKLAIDNPMNTKNGGLNSAVWIFNMKNRFKWTDRVEVEAGEETKNVIKLAYKL
jgi:DNA-binding XRE family transcriptional regulator